MILFFFILFIFGQIVSFLSKRKPDQFNIHQKHPGCQLYATCSQRLARHKPSAWHWSTGTKNKSTCRYQDTTTQLCSAIAIGVLSAILQIGGQTEVSLSNKLKPQTPSACNCISNGAHPQSRSLLKKTRLTCIWKVLRLYQMHTRLQCWPSCPSGCCSTKSTASFSCSDISHTWVNGISYYWQYCIHQYL